MYKRLKHALIVDDSPEFRYLLSTILTENRVESVALRDGAEAIAYLALHSVDLIITDFRMPHVDGVQLLNWCRANELHTPVIFTTSDSKLFNSEEIALGDCCATLLKKPLDLKILQAALNAADRFDHHADCLHGSLKDAFTRTVAKMNARQPDFDNSYSEGL